VGSVCRVKRFHLGGKRFADEEEAETEVRKWLRQQPEDFCASGFGALVKRWYKYISVGGGYVEKQIFFQFRISRDLRFISPPSYVTYGERMKHT
jgi:hypothetical protein